MKIATYYRDDAHMITYQGTNDHWDSEAELLTYFCRDDEVIEIDELTGWPHPFVEWHGDLGIGREA